MYQLLDALEFPLLVVRFSVGDFALPASLQPREGGITENTVTFCH